MSVKLLKNEVKESNYFESVKIINNEDDFYASDEFNRVWEGYSSFEKDRTIRVGKTFKFIKGFVISVDPNKNYGRDFKLFKVYKTDEGLTFIKEETVGGSLHNGGLNRAFLFDDGFVRSENYYENSKSNRREMVKQDWVIFNY